MREIEVLQPRAIIIGKTILFPGKNPVTDELGEQISKRKGTQKALAMFERAGVIKLHEKADPKAPKFDTTDSLAGLDDEKALKVIELETDKGRLEKWKKKAKPALKVAIEDRIAMLELEAEGS